MGELAEAAGVGVRTLYRGFGSRQALLREAGCTPQPTNRELVLASALDLVGRRGLAELSMDDLAAASGVSRATVYRLFPGKPALFGALIRAFSPWEAVAEVIEAMPDADPDEVIPAVAQVIADALQGRIGLLLRIVSELATADPDTADGMARGMARGLPDLARYLNEQMAAGRLRATHPVLAAQLLAGPIVVHLLTRPIAEAQPGFDITPAEAVAEIAQAWLRAMTKPATDQT